MRSRITILFGVLASLLFSCQNDESQLIQAKTITIPKPGDTKDLKKLSQIFSVKRIIPLETTNESLIGKIDKIVELPDDRGFLVLDKSSASKLFLFNDVGVFTSFIGKKGKGPNEYSQITEFCYSNGRVYILDSSMDKILKFSINNGWQGNIDVPKRTKDFAILSEDQIILYNLGPDEILISNHQGKFVKSILKAQNARQGVQSNAIIETQEFINYRSQFSDTLLSWRIDSSNSPGLINLELPGKLIREEEYQSSITNAQKLANGTIQTIYNIIHTSQFTYLVYTLGSDLFYSIVRNNSMLDQYSFTNQVSDDITYLPWAPQIKGVGIKNELLGVVYPERIISLKSFNKDYSSRIRREDNPIITMLTIK